MSQNWYPQKLLFSWESCGFGVPGKHFRTVLKKNHPKNEGCSMNMIEHNGTPAELSSAFPCPAITHYIYLHLVFSLFNNVIRCYLYMCTICIYTYVYMCIYIYTYVYSLFDTLQSREFNLKCHHFMTPISLSGLEDACPTLEVAFIPDYIPLWSTLCPS